VATKSADGPTPAAQAKPDPRHVAEFAYVEPWLARGDQPDQDGYRWLRAHGTELVVNLRLRSDKHNIARAAPQLKALHIPVRNNRPPLYRQVAQWLALCAAAERRQALLFVHCRGGRGRTSLFCALFRLAQGHSVEEAIEEQRRFGFEPEGLHRKQADFLREFGSLLSAFE